MTHTWRERGRERNAGSLFFGTGSANHVRIYAIAQGCFVFLLFAEEHALLLNLPVILRACHAAPHAFNQSLEKSWLQTVIFSGCALAQHRALLFPCCTFVAISFVRSFVHSFVRHKVGDSVRVLPCFHRFHVDEIDDWLDRNTSCPLCHLDINEALTG